MSFNELMSDQVFLSKLYDARDEKDVVALFANEGLNLTAESIKQYISNNYYDLTDEELKKVSGGNCISWFYGKLKEKKF